MKRFLEGLAFIASKQIMHRDIKQENLMFKYKEKHDKPYELVLIDFGLSSFDYVQEYIYRRCGTPGFVAPEIIKLNK